MIAIVNVGVALSRPPKLDEFRRVVLSIDTPDDGSKLDSAETEAILVATQLAGLGSVMPVFAEIESIEI
jgi:hypothetical protein